MARPKILGNVIRRINMNCNVNGKDKDYRITVTRSDIGGNTLTRVYCEYGPANKLRDGKELDAFVSEYLANEYAENLVREKRNQPDAYHVISDHAFPENSLPSAKGRHEKAFPSAPTPPRMTLLSLSVESRSKISLLF